jgi:hypothetical protein
MGVYDEFYGFRDNYNIGQALISSIATLRSSAIKLMRCPGAPAT